MSTFEGFSRLQTPADLLQKLVHDLARMTADPEDEYAAFDFFLTAEHMVDWIHPDSRREREQLRSSKVVLQVTSHVASGAKHFRATALQHRSVESVKRSGYVEPGYVESGYFLEPVAIYLSPAEAAYFGGKEIEAVALGQKIVEYWRAKLLVA